MRRHARVILLIVQVVALAGVLATIRSGAVPLGVKGEWEWLRVTARPEPAFLTIAAASVAIYAGYAAVAMRSIGRGGRAAGWLVGLVPMAGLVQAGAQAGAPAGYGLEKWAFALVQKGSSGYYTVARDQIRDLPGFLAAYPEWIQHQDALHVGTHPPGLFVTSWAALRLMGSHPGTARAIATGLPRSFHVGFESVPAARPMPWADRAALAMTGLLILVACSATVVPLYALARRWLSAPASWMSAALWPLASAALMFQPAADAAFPLLSTSALALAARSGRWAWTAVAAGVVLAIGAQFSLVFFPVGLVAGLVMAADGEIGWRRRAARVAGTGIGFLVATALLGLMMRANPLAIWWANAANHARFYVEFPRSYWSWVAENPVELAVAIGVPAAVWLAAGVGRGPVVSWATLGVLAFLTVSGKNLSEVARLWLPLMPTLLTSAGAGGERVGAGPAGLAATLVLLGVQALVLESLIQVVYPVS